MNGLIKHQVIENNGQPLFVLMPYEEYLTIKDIRPVATTIQTYIPLAVSKAVNLDGKSLVRAWREYKGLSQAQVAAQLNVSRPTYAQMEKSGAKLRNTTVHRLATALDVAHEQLRE